MFCIDFFVLIREMLSYRVKITFRHPNRIRRSIVLEHRNMDRHSIKLDPYHSIWAVIRHLMHISCTPVNTLLSIFATEPLFDHISKLKISQITTYCSCRNWFWQANIQVRCSFRTSIALDQLFQMSTLNSLFLASHCIFLMGFCTQYLQMLSYLQIFTWLSPASNTATAGTRTIESNKFLCSLMV